MSVKEEVLDDDIIFGATELEVDRTLNDKHNDQLQLLLYLTGQRATLILVFLHAVVLLPWKYILEHKQGAKVRPKHLDEDIKKNEIISKMRNPKVKIKGRFAFVFVLMGLESHILLARRAEYGVAFQQAHST
ncbi:hypothetical protein P691DRAFT_759021 [Macrolepiota fuliginosa MF-IS2]|uniref:Uncharacterized protein n=1 Tax=Macrolepiota fuliginosa MF-IS2 TaxID=1400762 RepID=A0A9P5XFW8_9AGAR|nr:hypothetical protein P691DRAFT_759021 [Macrolepiota fuliginosa MF-IS2]